MAGGEGGGIVSLQFAVVHEAKTKLVPLIGGYRGTPEQ